MRMREFTPEQLVYPPDRLARVVIRPTMVSTSTLAIRTEFVAVGRPPDDGAGDDRKANPEKIAIDTAVVNRLWPVSPLVAVVAAVVGLRAG
jgi:hypothetical protein